MRAQQCARNDVRSVGEYLLRKLLGLGLRRKGFGLPGKCMHLSPFRHFNRNEPMIFHPVSGHDPAGHICLKRNQSRRKWPRVHPPGPSAFITRRGDHRRTPDCILSLVAVASIAADQNVAEIHPELCLGKLRIHRNGLSGLRQ